MKHTLRRILAVLLCAAAVFACRSTVFAQEAEEEQAVQQATDISEGRFITDSSGFLDYGFFFDHYIKYGVRSNGNAHFTAAHEEGIGSIYILFHHEYGVYEVINNDNGQVATVGQHRFLHDFLDMQALFGTAPSSVTVRFPNGSVDITEVYLFTPGEVPDFVQKWQPPKDGETDLVLFSTHADDEHLFFAGILPHYAAALDYQVQVVYLTDHRNSTPFRFHEALDGLWAVGMDTYPVFGSYADFHLKTLADTYDFFAQLGNSKEELTGYVVEQMRRFKPKVVVTHDFAGEYGHGQHMVYADLVATALEISNDPQQYPELAEQYGVWDVPKAYFHLYQENQIIMDWDQPLERFDGKTAFEVSIWLGFQQHESQIKGFRWYYEGFPNARSLPKFNPCYYGLYRSTVGEDVEKNDFFENVTTHEQDRIAEEERLAEEARLKAEDEARKKAEDEAARLAEEQARLDAEAKAMAEAEAQAKAEAEAKQAQERADRIRKTTILVMAPIAAAAAVFAVVRGRKKKV